MQPIATDDPVAWCVSLMSVTRLRCAKTAERIEFLFAENTFVDPRSIVSDRGVDPHGDGKGFDAVFANGLLLACQRIRQTESDITE